MKNLLAIAITIVIFPFIFFGSILYVYLYLIPKRLADVGVFELIYILRESHAIGPNQYGVREEELW